MGDCADRNASGTSVWRPRCLVAACLSAFLALGLCVRAQASPTPPAATSEEYQFDENLLFGVGSLARFNKPSAVEPGRYTVELYINNHFVQRADVRFLETSNKEVQPCLSAALLENAGVLRSAIQAAASEDCPLLAQTINGASFTFDLGTLRLDLSVPQSLINRTPRGYVPPDSLDSGATMGFMNYNLNHYHVTRTGSYTSRTERLRALGARNCANQCPGQHPAERQ
ncbi:FimD/PapC N-terminal domain-containing protein [Pseudomonas sp. MDT1-17]